MGLAVVSYSPHGWSSALLRPRRPNSVVSFSSSVPMERRKSDRPTRCSLLSVVQTGQKQRQKSLLLGQASQGGRSPNRSRSQFPKLRESRPFRLGRIQPSNIHPRVFVKTLHGCARPCFVLAHSRVAFLSARVQVYPPDS